MRTPILFCALAASLFGNAACRGHAGTDAGNQSADAASVDTGVPPRDTGTRHFDPCVNDSDCPIGDLCSVPATQPPRTDGTAPLQCRPRCTTETDCIMPLVGVTYALECAVDGFCSGRCATSAMVAPCMTPYQCHLFAGFQDGYCYLPAP